MKTFLLSFCAAFLALAFSIKVNAQAPTITSFSPDSGPVGSTVVITGTNFSPVAENNVVYIGRVKAVVTAATTTSLSVTVPAGALQQPLSVTVNGSTAYSSTPFVVTSPCSNPTLSFTRTNYRLAGSPLADIDGDGKVDFYRSKAPDSLSILRNLSVGDTLAFAPEVNFQTGSTNVQIFDWDGDGKLDLIVVNTAANMFSVVRNTSSIGNISFAPKVDVPFTGSPTIVDWDADGKSDLVIINAASNTFSVFRNTSSAGNISFAPKVDVSFTGSPSMLDWDRDGKLDLVVINSVSNTFSVYRNTSSMGNISFAPKVDVTFTGSPTMMDWDGDGKLDLVVINAASNTFSVFRNTSSAGNISFAPRLDASVPGIGSLSMRDLNGDGKKDLYSVQPAQGGGTLSVYLNISTEGTLAFANKVDFPIQVRPEQPYIEDFDGDGKPDFVFLDYATSSFVVLRNTSTGGTVSFEGAGRYSTAINPRPLTIVDLNKDGKLDLLTYGGFGQNYYATVLGNTSTPGTISFAGGGGFGGELYATQPILADLTGDGKPEAIVQSVTTDQCSEASTIVTIYQNTSTTGSVSFRGAQTFSFGGCYVSIGIVDYNGDGKSELVISGFVYRNETTCSPCAPAELPTLKNDSTIALNPTCGNSDGNITIEPTRGTAPFLYSKDGGATYVSGSDAGYTFNNLGAGTYKLRLKDARGCESAIIEKTLTSSNCPPTICNDPTFNPTDRGFGLGDGPNGIILSTVLQSDGKIIIGGDFTSYNGIARNRLARLNTDFTLDASFNPGTGANGIIFTANIQSDGKIIIGGDFTSYNGTGRNRIARVNTDGTLDASFNPGTGASSQIHTTAIQSDGKIIIGGLFTYYNGTARSNIARLNTDGSLDASFNPGIGANHVIFTTAIQSDGKIIIGGLFTSYNGTVRNRIARLNTDGSLDAGFNPGTGAGDYIGTTAIQSDGKIIIGGNFTSYNGTVRNRVARLNIDGSLDASFNPGTGANSYIRTTAIQSDGKIIIGGEFTSYNGTARRSIARLNTDGTLDASFNPGTGANNVIRTTAIQSDGKIIIGGNFTSYNGTLRNYIARLNTNGSLETGFNSGTGADGPIYATSLQSDGKIIIGGDFTSYNATARNRIARLNTDGTLDASFNPGSGANDLIRTTALQSDGKIIIGGAFTSYNGTARSYIARLNTDFTLDAGFNPGTGANNYIRTTALQSDGKIIIGGDFTSYNGTARNRIARLNTDGSLDAGFNPGTGANNYIRTTAIQSDGKIIIGGDFTSYNGTAINGIARLNTDGSLDETFNRGTGPGPSFLANNPFTIQTTAIQSDGKIIIGGVFTTYNEIARNRIARLNTDGSLDAGFNPGTGANNGIYTTLLQSDGKIIIGGDFTTYDGTVVNRLARLNTDGTLDAGFNPGTGANNTIYTTSLQSDGKIIIGGAFTAFNGTGRNRIARVMDCASSCTPPTFVNNGLIILDATCANNDGNINILPITGTAPFMYSIDGGTTYVTGPNAGYGFQNLASGTYKLRLKDAKGCESAIVERVVKLNCTSTCTPPTFVNNGLIILDATCANNDGNINILPLSGTAPFMYSIDGGATYVSGPNAGYGFQGLASGTYKLRLKEANGCESAIVERVVKLLCATACTPPTFVNNGLIVLDASCGKSDGSISIIPTSGTAPFMYSINGGTTYVAGPDAGYGFQNLPAGTYQLRLKDSRGCESAIVERTVRNYYNCPGMTVSKNSPDASLESSNRDVISTYPNPNRGQFKLLLQNFNSSKAEVSIGDAKGTVIQRRSLNLAQTTIVDFDLKGKARGMYLIKVVSSNGSKVSKVVIQ